MNTYRIRKGICLINVAGQDLLVADREARKQCPYIWEISQRSAFFWKELKEGAGTKEILRKYADCFGIEERIAARDLMVFTAKCRKYHYMELTD